jgi:hypothetical protein
MSRTIGILLLLVCSAPAQSSGPYTITQSVIAGGGTQNAGGGTFGLSGTVGQVAAGTESSGGQYRLRGGFWAENPLAPAAAPVSISGRVMTSIGRGIENVRVTLTAPSGESRLAVTSSFGYYVFDDVPAGESYIIAVRAKRFTFAQSSTLVVTNADLTGIDFAASEP